MDTAGMADGLRKGDTSAASSACWKDYFNKSPIACARSNFVVPDPDLPKPIPDRSRSEIKRSGSRGLPIISRGDVMSRNWLNTPGRLRLAFIGVMVLLGSTLGWLTWELLERQQQTERETAAQRAVAILQRKLSEVEQDLSRLSLNDDAGEPAEGAVFVRFRADGIRAWPAGRLLYYPELPASAEIPEFGAIEQMELRGDHSGAIAALRKRSESPDPKVRASATAAIARNHIALGQLDKALEAFSQLSALGAVPVDGLPAALAAQSGTIAVLEKQKDVKALARSARQLLLDLYDGKWPVSYAAYESLSNQAQTYLSEPPSAPKRIALAEGIHELWEKWNGNPAMNDDQLSTRTSAGPILLVWRTSKSEMAMFAAEAEHIDREWLSEVKASSDGSRAQLGLMDRSGNPVLGNQPRFDGLPVTLFAQNTHLPWTLQVFNVDDGLSWTSRRALIVASMIVLFTLILVGSWFIGHAISRELAVARLQSDFVSAVSHEFRTPLTALLQVSELLKRGRVATEEDRREYYDALHEESQRLHRLVESLLNFGRLESGKLWFRFEELDAAAFLRQSTAEFAEGQQARGYRFEVETRAESSTIRADRETLRCVFWNLFENAVKYSPDCRTVWVDLTKNDSRVEISVRDQGVGIPRNEQRSVFEKFVRGSAARDRGIGGTGIGLAMARQIVRAHGGDITLESEPGKGSTFRVLLPVKVT
jgi:signal transduction histidine kinase